MRWPGFRLGFVSILTAALALAELVRGLTAYRNQPERRSHRQTKGCHHGRDGRH